MSPARFSSHPLCRELHTTQLLIKVWADAKNKVLLPPLAPFQTAARTLRAAWSLHNKHYCENPLKTSRGLFNYAIALQELTDWRSPL